MSCIVVAVGRFVYMSTLYPVREASEEDAHLTTSDADVIGLLADNSSADAKTGKAK